ncbi:MAG: hypothetical protein ACUVWX_06800 [Kiritimatiellia bacterium]
MAGAQGKNKTPRFACYVGIDYSGAKSADDPVPGLRVYLAAGEREPQEAFPVATSRRGWSRRTLALWLEAMLGGGEPIIVGIDHVFSFPRRYFRRHGLPLNWDAFLADFCLHWPTDQMGVWVDAVRHGNCGPGWKRSGESRWRRVADIVAPGAKSVFHFDIPGCVAKSSHAGLPWLRYLRQRCGTRVHFWPFDGWEVPAGKHVVAEVFPSLWRDRYPVKGLSPHQRDAYVICRWLQEADRDGRLTTCFTPALPTEVAAQARYEGWILGIGQYDRSESVRRSLVG